PYDLANGQAVAFADYKGSDSCRIGTCRRAPVQVLLWPFAADFSGRGSQPAIASIAGGAPREARAPQVASPRLVELPPKHGVGGLFRVRDLLSFLLEPIYRFLQRHPAFPNISGAAPSAHAAVDLPARLGRVCHERRQPSDVHSRPFL